MVERCEVHGRDLSFLLRDPVSGDERTVSTLELVTWRRRSGQSQALAFSIPRDRRPARRRGGRQLLVGRWILGAH